MRISHTMTACILAAAVLPLSACQKSESDKAAAPAAVEAAPAAGGSAGAARTPRLRAGLWRVTMGGEGPGGESRMCLDDALQARMSVIGAQASAGACQQSVVTPRAGGGFNFRTVCDATAMGGGRTVSVGEITGDLTTRYASRSTVTTEGAPVAHMNRAMTATAEGAYVGPCPADMKPGDMEMDGGMRFNMAGMAEMAARMQPPQPSAR